MEIKDIEKIERQRGIASTVKADDLIPVYAERVEKFLRDNQSSMGDKWVKMAADHLYNFFEKNGEGDVLGSSTDMDVAIATFCPEIPLITGQQLLGLYMQAGNKNPFGNVYIDFGVQVNGAPEINSAQAKIILNDFKKRGIDVGEGIVPNFNQLKLVAHNDAGLAYRLGENVSKDNFAFVSVYPFGTRIGKDGLFGASLGRVGDWFADVDYLSFSVDGRVVRYDAEGVAPKKLAQSESNLVKVLTNNFMKRF